MSRSKVDSYHHGWFEEACEKARLIDVDLESVEGKEIGKMQLHR